MTSATIAELSRPWSGAERRTAEEAERDAARRRSAEMDEWERARLDALLRRAGVDPSWAASPRSAEARELGERVWRKAVSDAEAWGSCGVCPGLYAVGEAGRGKTWCAMGAVAAALSSGSSALLLTEQAMLDAFRACRDERGGSEARWASRLASVGLLAIDDVGSSKPCEEQCARLFEVLDARVERGRATVVTTQYERDELAERLARGSDAKRAHALVSRLKRLRVLRFEGPDRRLADAR